MSLRNFVTASCLLLVSCGGMSNKGKINEYVAPGADPRTIKRIALIAGSDTRGNRQVMVRARDRLTQAGVTLIRRPGEWGSNSEALKDICTQRAESPDNVDGVVFVSWDNLALHECKTGTVATTVSGGYAGIDALVDRLLYHLGFQAPAK